MSDHLKIAPCRNTSTNPLPPLIVLHNLLTAPKPENDVTYFQMSYRAMIETIQKVYPDFSRCNNEDGANDTSKAWRVPGFKGKVTKDMHSTNP